LPHNRVRPKPRLLLPLPVNNKLPRLPLLNEKLNKRRLGSNLLDSPGRWGSRLLPKPLPRLNKRLILRLPNNVKRRLNKRLLPLKEQDSRDRLG